MRKRHWTSEARAWEMHRKSREEEPFSDDSQPREVGDGHFEIPRAVPAAAGGHRIQQTRPADVPGRAVRRSESFCLVDEHDDPFGSEEQSQQGVHNQSLMNPGIILRSKTHTEIAGAVDSAKISSWALFHADPPGHIRTAVGRKRSPSASDIPVVRKAPYVHPLPPLKSSSSAEIKPSAPARAITVTPPAFDVISTLEQFKDLAADLKADIAFGWTLHLNSNDYIAAFVAYPGWRKDAKAFYVKFPALPTDCEPFFQVLSLIMSSDTVKIAFQTQKLLRKLLDQDIVANGELVDPCIAAWVLNDVTFLDLAKKETENEESLLNALVAQYLGRASLVSRYRSQSDEERCVYTTVEAFRLAEALEKRIQNADSTNRLFQAFRKIEMDVVNIIVKMEHTGVGFSPAVCQHGKQQAEDLASELEQRAHASVRGDFQISSCDSVAELLYTQLQLPTDGIRRTGSNKRFAVDQDALETLLERPDCPHVVDLICQWRKLDKLIKGYFPGLLTRATWHPEQHMHRIHCTIQHTATPTGRLATCSPNLQAIPREELCLATLDGRELHFGVRQMFVPRQGSVLLSADYSQLEVRLLAHLCNDHGLVSLMRDPNADLFRSMARSIYNVEEVSDAQRDNAKRIIYGILYGMGPARLARALDTSEAQAKSFNETFFRRFPGVRDWMTAVIDACKRVGYVTTLCGKRRHLLDINSATSGALRAAAQRRAVNTMCQGSAAELVKLAMIRVCKELEQLQAPTPSRLLMQIHDELLLEVPETDVPRVAPLVKKAMEQVLQDLCPLRVPLLVKLRAGPSWGQMQPLLIKL